MPTRGTELTGIVQPEGIVLELSRYVFEPLRKDEDFILYRGRSKDDGSLVLVLAPLTEYPAPEILKWLEHAYSLREELDSTWAARPIAIARHWDRTVLVLEDPGGVPLDQLLGRQLDLAVSLRLAVSLSSAIDHLHQRGIIHKDIKPANVLVNSATGQVWLTGFGIASRLPRERQSPEPPEFIAGTLPYMAPEQTGTHESLDRFPERPLLARRHALRNADWQSSVHGFRSDGMGSLPYRETASCRPASGWKTSRALSPPSS